MVVFGTSKHPRQASSAKASNLQSAESGLCCNIPLADVGSFAVGDGKRVTDHVRFLRYRGNDQLDVDLLGYLYRVIDLDAEIPNGALDLRMPKQELHST